MLTNSYLIANCLLCDVQIIIGILLRFCRLSVASQHTWNCKSVVIK